MGNGYIKLNELKENDMSSVMFLCCVFIANCCFNRQERIKSAAASSVFFSTFYSVQIKIDKIDNSFNWHGNQCDEFINYVQNV